MRPGNLLLLCIFRSRRAESLLPRGRARSPFDLFFARGRDHRSATAAPRREPTTSSAFASPPPPPFVEAGRFRRRRTKHRSGTLAGIPRGRRRGDCRPTSTTSLIDEAPPNDGGRIDERPRRDHYHLTILIPAYNERDRIGETLSSYVDRLSRMPVYQRRHHLGSGRDGKGDGSDGGARSPGVDITSGSVSILVVDDGSADGTADYARGGSWRGRRSRSKSNRPSSEGRDERCEENEKFWRVDENVAVVSLPENVGKGAAIERGMAELPPCRVGLDDAGPSKESAVRLRRVVLVADADGSGDVSCLDDMLRSLEDLLSTSSVAAPPRPTTTADDAATGGSETRRSSSSSYESHDLPPALVAGRRRYPLSKKSPLRSLLSWGFRTCVSLVFLGASLGARDTQCGFKLMTASAGRTLYRELNLRGWTHDVEVLHRARLLDVPVGECDVPWIDKGGSKLVKKPSDAVLVSAVMLGEIATMRARYALGNWKATTGIEE